MKNKKKTREKTPVAIQLKNGKLKVKSPRTYSIGHFPDDILPG